MICFCVKCFVRQGVLQVLSTRWHYLLNVVVVSVQPIPSVNFKSIPWVVTIFIYF